jgi:predicted XRE-type DNA-binding protein
MNPYDVDYTKLKPSKEITDPKDLFKLKLLAHFNDIIETMTTDEVSTRTGLDKSDISRLKVSDFKRFTMDRLIKILDLLGYTCELKLKPKKVS